VAVDSHAHVFLQRLPLASARRYAPAFDATPAQYLGLLDAHGITHGVLVQPSFLGNDNRFLLDTLRAHPGRLRGVVMTDPAADEKELASLDAAGVVGVRLNLVGQPLPDLGTSGWQTFLARLKALDWHLELHREAADLPALLDAALPAGCRIVVDHFGRPHAAQADGDPGFAALLRRAASGRVWVKLSAAYRNARGVPQADAQGARACARALLDAFGPEPTGYPTPRSAAASSAQRPPSCSAFPPPSDKETPCNDVPSPSPLWHWPSRRPCTPRPRQAFPTSP